MPTFQGFQKAPKNLFFTWDTSAYLMFPSADAICFHLSPLTQRNYPKGVGGGGGKCLEIKTGRCSFDTVLNFSTKTSIILTSSSLPFPPSDSDLSLIHSTKLSKSLQLIVWIEVGSDSSWTFLLDN